MSTLIKKGLVIKTSNPAKYSITTDGCNMAEKLAAASATDGPISSSSQVPFVITAGHGSSTTQNNELSTQNDGLTGGHVDWIADKSLDALKVK